MRDAVVPAVVWAGQEAGCKTFSYVASPCPASQVVENFELYRRFLNVEPEDEAALRSARAIIERLRRRELYKYATECLIPQAGDWGGGRGWEARPGGTTGRAEGQGRQP